MKGENVLDMSTFLGGIGSLFTEMSGWVVDLVEIVLQSPALTVVTFGLLIVGAVFGYTSRLIRGR